MLNAKASSSKRLNQYPFVRHPVKRHPTYTWSRIPSLLFRGSAKRPLSCTNSGSRIRPCQDHRFHNCYVYEAKNTTLIRSLLSGFSFIDLAVLWMEWQEKRESCNLALHRYSWVEFIVKPLVDVEFRVDETRRIGFWIRESVVIWRGYHRCLANILTGKTNWSSRWEVHINSWTGLDPPPFLTLGIVLKLCMVCPVLTLDRRDG